MYLSESDVREIAAYTRIALSGDEVASVAVYLNDVIESLSPITEFDLEGVEPTYHPIAGLSNVMREDIQEQSFTQEEALANAARTQNGCFVVPSILGGGDVQ